MNFEYVDRVFELEKFKSIRGLKNVTRNEPFFYWLPDGRRVLSPAVISEALGQLGGWLEIVSTDYTKQPVFLADEKTEYLGYAKAGDQIDLEVEVLDFDEETVFTRGRALIDGKPILVGYGCRGYLLDIEECRDPVATKCRFNRLFKPELAGVDRLPPSTPRLKAIAGPSTFNSLQFIDGIIEHQPYEKVAGFKNFTACEPYFLTHFPRKPIVPGILLLTFIGEVCQYLIKPELNGPLRSRALIPTFIQKVRFRKFVEPGDQCTVEAKLIKGNAELPNSDIVIKAMMKANGSRVMQAELGFRTMHSGVAFKEADGFHSPSLVSQI